MADELAEADRIEADIARTRARMDDRLDQLQDHLSPRQMLNDAFAYFRGGDGSDMAQDLFARARANPMPIALVGVGIAWLMAANGAAKAAPGRNPDDDLAPERSNGVIDASSHSTRTEPTFKQDTRNMAHSTRETLSSLASSPFALGAMAAVVGAVAGALIPTFEQEEAALGAAVTGIREKGRDLAHSVVDTGSRVVSDTLDAVRDSAESHGMSADKPVGDIVADWKSGDLIDNAKTVAGEALQAGRDSAEHHLLPQPQDGDQEPSPTDN